MQLVRAQVGSVLGVGLPFLLVLLASSHDLRLGEAGKTRNGNTDMTSHGGGEDL